MSPKRAPGSRLATPGAVLVLALLWPCAAPVAAAVPVVTNTASVTAANNDPAGSNNSSTAATAIQAPVVSVPTVSGYGLAALAVLLGAGAFVVSRRRTSRP